MNPNKLPQTIRSGRSPIVAIAVTTIAIIAISIYCLASGFFIIFQNLFYIPIIIACMYFNRRGFAFSVIIACLYFLLTLAFTRDPSILLQAFVRVLIFVLVAGVITHLSLARKRVEDSLRRQQDGFEGLVQERTAPLEADIAERKRAEEALQKSEKRLREAQEMAHLGFWTWDVKTGAVEWSEEVFKIFCLDPKEFTPQIDSILTLSPWPEDHQRDQELIKRAIETRSPGSYEQKFLRPDKSIGNYYSTFQGNFDEKGDLISMVGTVLDITERKRGEEALRESEDKFSKAFLTSPYAITITRAKDGGFIEVNNAFTLIAGYTREEALADSSVGLKLWANEEERESVVADLRAGRAVEDREYQFRTKIGKNITGLFSAQIIKLNSGPCILSSINDITERKQAEEALRESEDKFKYVFDNSSVGKSITSPTGEAQMNKAFCEMLGYSPEELQKIRWQDISDPADIDSTQKEVEALISGQKSAARFIKRYLHKNGSVVWADVSTSLRRDGQGKPLYFMTTVIDISERKRAEEALQVTLADLERSNADLEQFAYVASHDLQEPLRMVSSFTQLLGQRYKGKLDKDADEFIGFAVDGANHMQRLINDLLLYSRVGTRGKPPAPVPANLALDRALENLKLALKESQAEVKREPLPTVTADDVQLTQVFQNLIANAIKFHDEKPPRITVTCRERGSEWVFSVSDSGIGIDPDYLERIFIIFQRLNPPGKYSGTGIGLAICKKIVQRHGGRIWAESKPGKGSTFYFSLPRTGGK
jgi:PAS domain S-box-containing protein